MSMLPLIIPPVVLVLCLVFLVWFLSKKSEDPELQERLATLDQSRRSKKFLLFFSRDWGWRLLERLLQKLKLISLKFHNQFQEFSQVLKRKREAVHPQDGVVAEEATQAPLITEDKDRFWDRWHRRHRLGLEAVSSRQDSVQDSAVELVDASRQNDEGEVAVVITDSAQSKNQSRFSGLRKKVTSLTQGNEDPSAYFIRKKSVANSVRKMLSEEELIDRIAKNPKDAASYEELGDYYLANENLEDAKACYRQVIKLLPLNREVKDKVRKLERLLVQRDRRKG